MTEAKKIERIPGTHYVRVEHNIYNTMPASSEPKQVVCLCLFCGDKFGSASGACPIYCKNCKTADQRKKLLADNEAIKKENIAKGYKYAS